ncbi:MAG: hypothetical protein U9N35_01275 [Euryarchaeota archaeon]|nr:hypothetical protein [Euryarchaeota archaeon]
MRKVYLAPLAILCLLTGCISTPTGSNATKETAQRTLSEAVGVRPGVYVSNDPAALPLPTGGYDIYVIGEVHGIHEVQQLFIEYLKMLHEANGLRDIVLEGSQFYEGEFNKYILGLSDRLWPTEYSVDIPMALRMYNKTLPQNEKIHVHCPDIYPHISTMHGYLCVLKEEIGRESENIEIPPLKEFERWKENEILAMIDHLMESTENDELLNELKTAKASVQCFFAKTMEQKYLIREETTAQNIKYLSKELDGAPVLALYGDWHAKKHDSIETHPYVHPWASRLTEKGVTICSIYALGLEGRRWSPTHGEVVTFHHDSTQIQFADGSTLADIFNENPEYTIAYIDLKELNSLEVEFYRSTYVLFDPTTPAGRIFDGIVVFKEVTPKNIIK